MPSLDLYKPRKYSTMKLSDNVEYKIPNEYTVEEVERLLEFRTEQEAIEAESVDEARQEKQVERFWQVVYAQLEILFQHYQPEITVEYLKKVITHNEALEMIGFFQKYRHSALLEIKAEREAAEADSADADKTSKKKLA